MTRLLRKATPHEVSQRMSRDLKRARKELRRMRLELNTAKVEADVSKRAFANRMGLLAKQRADHSRELAEVEADRGKAWRRCSKLTLKVDQLQAQLRKALMALGKKALEGTE
jgi:multidrug resistance efflux pump